jgi:signal transduction histidine kinase
MTKGAPAGEVIRCVQDVHVRELIGRIHWAVRIRWFFAAVSLALGAAAAFGLAGGEVHVRGFVGVGLFLLLANAYYRYRARLADARCVGTHELRAMCFLQVLGDYAALAVIVYALGSVETPIMFMVLPNIILAALFFTRVQSLLISAMGVALVSLPLLLEAAGVLPVVTVYHGGLKQILLEQPAYLAGFLAILAACVLFSWYLVSTITASLIRNELALERSYEAVLRLDAEKTRAMVRGTHELKAPLAAIRGYAYALRDGYAGPLPERARGIVLRIGERCDRLVEKITDIIRLSNLQSYVRSEDRFHALDLQETLRREIEEAREAGRSRGVAIRFAPATAPVLANATEGHLQTLFANLLANAVQYSHEGGEVEVSVGCGGGRATVAVCDHGIGIPEASLPHIFEEHYRAGNAAAHHPDGTGLGLTIVQAVARLLEAEIEVKSAVGEGTCFSVSFRALEHSGG